MKHNLLRSFSFFREVGVVPGLGSLRVLFLNLGLARDSFAAWGVLGRHFAVQ